MTWMSHHKSKPLLLTAQFLLQNKRFLQTTIPPTGKEKQKKAYQLLLPIFPVTRRALVDRFNALSKQLPEANRVLKAEREENWRRLDGEKKASAVPEDLKERLKTGKLIPLQELVKLVKEAAGTVELEAAIAVLREQRFLGAPVHEEIAAVLQERISAVASEEERLSLREKLLYPSQMSPLPIDFE